MDEEKQYHFCASFFENGENIKEVYNAFRKCMEILDVPVDVSLVFDGNSPNGKIVFTRRKMERNMNSNNNSVYQLRHSICDFEDYVFLTYEEAEKYRELLAEEENTKPFYWNIFELTIKK